MQPLFPLEGTPTRKRETTKEAVNPSVLRWARETGGLTLDDAAAALSIGDAYGQTGAQRLAALERGDDAPSRALLLKMADKYHRNLVVFYLDAPPERGDRGEDFRLAPGSQPDYDATLDALIRRIRASQDQVRSLLEDEEATPVPLVGSRKLTTPRAEMSQFIIDSINFQLEEFRKQRDIDDAFRYLRGCIEAAGVFVLLAGNLGTYHTDIEPEVFRGFVIADPLAPFIVINDQDSHAAWSFTALHELIHVVLGDTGLSGGTVNTATEEFCSDVASQVLLPRDDVLRMTYISTLNDGDALEAVAAVAWEWRLSSSMVVYRLKLADIISTYRWNALAGILRARHAQPKDNGSTGGRGNYYAWRRHRLGPALLSLVQRSLRAGTITRTKAAYVLGVRPRFVDRVLTPPPVVG